MRLHSTLWAALVLAACARTTTSEATLSPTVPSQTLALTQATGCYVDTDCAAGLFCFQSRCTFECSGATACPLGERCTSRGRCLDQAREAAAEAASTSATVDPEQVAGAPSEVPVKVLVPPAPEIEVPEGAPFVEVTLTTEAVVPEGALLYRVEVEGATRQPISLRASGSTSFTFSVPTGTAGSLDAAPTVQRVTLVTSVGGFALSLVPRITVDGLYAGEVAVREFGGSALPLRFGLRVVPSTASFADATERYLILPASPQDLFSPVNAGTAAEPAWVERQLELDPVSGVWFARYAAPFAMPPGSQFAGNEHVVRALRIELSGMEGKRLSGAVADRWLGLFASRSADGVPTPGNVGLAGLMTATRVQPLPAAARKPLAGSGATATPPVSAPITIDACPASVFAGLTAGLGGLTDAGVPTGPCPGITTAAAFTGAASSTKASCALALADKALTGPSTAAQVRAFLDQDPSNDPGGLSFGAFLEKCAARDGYCVATPELLCTAQLLAHAYQTQGSELTEAGALLQRFQGVAREGYLGRQLAAFQVDTTTRLEWLRTSEAPLFLASELKAYNEDILNRWKSQVLDAHFAVLATQFAPAGLEVLARAPTDATAISVRGQMLLEQSQTWQGAMEALEIATTRWNSLYQDTVSRESKAGLVRTRLFDLYLSAAVLAQLNRAAGSSATSSIFGSGFAALMRSLEQLALPFNQLIFMRDAEVVVSRSVDPTSSSRTLLADRENLARRAVVDAQDSVDRVLADAQRSAVDATVLTERMVAQAEELRSELVQVCGLPLGCSTTDFASRPECAVTTEIGRCGFVRDPLTGAYGSLDAIATQPSVSEAGQSVLAYRASLLELQTAQEEFRGNQQKAQIELDTADAFATKLADWDQRRRSVNGEVQALLDEIVTFQVASLTTELDGIRAAQGRRQQAYEVQKASAAHWADIRYAGVDADMRKMTSINALSQTGAWLTLGANEIDRLAETTADGFPKVAGTSVDVSAPGRFVIGMSAYGATTAIRAVQQGLDTAAAGVQLSLDEDRARRDAQLEELADLAALQAQQTENDLANMSGVLRAAQLKSDFEVSTREALIDALRRNLELDLAHDRDLVELKDRRDKVQLRLADSSRLRAQVLRTQIVASRHLLEYFEVAQRAQLLQGRLAALETRLENLTDLLASPSVIFAFANRLARAESRVDRAKTLLFDWLVALEYYAVRPFIDQRLAILLARNPSQLDAIANELVRLEGACGGIVNTAVAELSVRDDLLQLGFSTDTQTPAEHFRAALAKGNVPIDTRVRYSSDERVGDLLKSRKVLAASFDLRLDTFANLPLTCNAKLASVSVELIGKDLGSARPTVSILYDGTSTLRSCQPNIDTLVGALDPGTSSFGSLTRLRTPGRSISPLAHLGSFGADDSANKGLEGLPLASTYTVLIDPTAGENAHLAWQNLEDIKLKLTWAYQDVFPAGQCQ